MAYQIVSGKCPFCEQPAVRDGRVIFDAAVSYLSQSAKAAKIIDDFTKLKPVVKIHIATGSGDNKLWHEENQDEGTYPFEHICWNPLRQVQCAGRQMQSPAIGLIHEMGHAIQAVKDREFYEARAVNPAQAGAVNYVGKAKQAGHNAGKWKVTSSVHGPDVARSAEAWLHDIETNNITRHELPVIRELREQGFKEAERAKKACAKPTGLKECYYEDGGVSIDISMKGKAPDTEAAGAHRGKKVAEMTWAERVSCTVFCPDSK